MDQETSAAGDPEVEWTSDAEDLETEEVPEIEENPQIKGTSAAAEHTEIEGSPAAMVEYWEVEWKSFSEDRETEKVPEIERDPHINGTSVTAEHTEIEGTPASMGEYREVEKVPEIEGDPQIKGTSAAAEHTEIKGTPAAMGEYWEAEWKSATNDPPMDEISAAEGFLPLMDRLIKVTEDAEFKESGERTHWPKSSIFRVPEHIKSSRESNFEPKLVSIGPYYHGRQNLKRMQDLKIRCIQEILKMLRRTNHPRPSEGDSPWSDRPRYATSIGIDPTLQKETFIDAEFLRQFIVSGRKAQEYYKEVFDHGDDEFVEMLFLDSCFIIRTIFAFSQQTQSMSFLDVHIKEVRSDLLLLDNQIPLFFIKEVYEWFLRNLKDKKLPQFNAFLEPFICLDMPWRINHDAKPSEAAHLLDLYWRYSLSPQMDMKLISSERYRSKTEGDLSNSSEVDFSNTALMVIANATELQQMAGIEFEKFKDKGHLDVTFSKGIMRMPRLKIDSRQITLLRNLIAFENCIVPSMRTISCYMKLMDALVNSEKDVELLQKCGVIYNTLSSHEMAATFFNDIGAFCFTDDNANPFSILYKDVQKYYESRWHRRFASLRHNYFSSPWTGISVVAAVILLILSVLQTFYAIYGYHHPKN